MLSRTADHLYWMSRYLERAENMARMIDAHHRLSLLPRAPADRARVRGLAQMIACEIHPLNNTRVLKYLTGAAGVSEETKNTWYCHWVAEGFKALEAKLAGHSATGKFCHGDTPGLAGCWAETASASRMPGNASNRSTNRMQMASSQPP